MFLGHDEFCMQVTIGLTGRKFQHFAKKSSVTEIWDQSRMITSLLAIKCDVFCKTAEFTDQTRRICFWVKHEMKYLTHSLVVLRGNYLFFPDFHFF